MAVQHSNSFLFLAAKRNQLYLEAFRVTLERWSDSEQNQLAEKALEVLGRIAEYNVLHNRNKREFTDRLVRQKVFDGVQDASQEALLECWDAIKRTPSGEIPLIKRLETPDQDVGESFQFKHLSFQEVLAADRITSSKSLGSANGVGSMPFKEMYTKLECLQVESVPFLRAVVGSYFEMGMLHVDHENVRESCDEALPKRTETETYFQTGFRELMLRQILTCSKFPTEADRLNLRDCAWLQSQDVQEWVKSGSNISELEIQGCILLDADAVSCFLSKCRNLGEIIFDVGFQTCKATADERGTLHVRGLRRIIPRPFTNPLTGWNKLSNLSKHAIFPGVRVISSSRHQSWTWTVTSS